MLGLDESDDSIAKGSKLIPSDAKQSKPLLSCARSQATASSEKEPKKVKKSKKSQKSTATEKEKN